MCFDKGHQCSKAIVMAAVFNFLGVLVMTAVNASVAMTIYNMVISEEMRTSHCRSLRCYGSYRDMGNRCVVLWHTYK